MNKEELNIEEEVSETPDFNALELGYLIKECKSVKKLEGLPAYMIQLTEPKFMGKLSTPADSLIVVPQESGNVTLFLRGPSMERLKDMNNKELIDFVRLYDPNKVK